MLDFLLYKFFEFSVIFSNIFSNIFSYHTHRTVKQNDRT